MRRSAARIARCYPAPVRLIDRHIAARFIWNTVVVFALLFVFAVSIDVILQVDRFLEAADAAVARGEFDGRLGAMATAVFNFHGPRVFQFYAYLLGMISVAGMSFTMAHMQRHRELVALLASGISLRRVAMPLVATVVALNLLQLANAEFVLPRLAPLLVREHAEILTQGRSRYPLPLTADASGTLLLAAAFDPGTETLEQLLAIERDANGRALRRIAAERATWDPARRAWRLEGGVGMRSTGSPDAPPMERTRLSREPVEFLETSLDPRSIAIRRSATFAQMLSLKELDEVAELGAIDEAVLARARWGRFAGVVANVVVFLLALPSFLLRAPSNLLARSVECAAITTGASLLVLVGMTVSVAGVPAWLAVFLPPMILAPMALGRLLGLRT